MSDYLDTNGLQRVWGKFKENISSYKEIEHESIATFADGTDNFVKSLEVAIEPQQDLHGYDSPWVGGAGKNKLPMVLNDIKSANTNGTWSGNTYTIGGLTFTILVDSNNNVTGINLNGTSDGWTSLMLKTNYPINANTYLLSCVGASGNKYLSNNLNGQEMAVTSNNDVQVVVSENTTMTSSIVIRPNSTITNVIMYPMLRLSTISDSTFAPYSNICPISGWSAVDVNKNGANQWDEEWEVGNINDGSGENLPQDNVIRSKNYISVISGASYYIKCPTSGISRLFLYREDKSYITYVPIENITNNIYTIPNNCAFIRFRTLAAYGTTYNNDISINYPSTDTEYHAYNGHTYTISLNGTRYSGKLDVVNGIVTPAPYYASYNGEALTGEWISDRDKYEVGATPTIGAQVVNIGASDTPVSIAPTIIKSLQGANNFFADSGEIIRVEYQPDNIVGELRSEIQSLDYDIFIVNCINNNGSWVTDVTESELRKAVNENKKIFMAYKNSLVPFIEMTSYTSYPNKATFSCADFGQTDLIQNKLELTKTTLEISFSDSSISEDIESLNLQLTV